MYPPPLPRKKLSAITIIFRITVGFLGALFVVAIISMPKNGYQAPAEAKSQSPSERILHDGDKGIARIATPCMRTAADLDEVMKWASRDDTEEMARTVVTRNGAILTVGSAFKVLDSGLLHSKIRIIKSDRECWVVPEATRQ